MRKRYPSDLTDARWEVLKPLIPPAKPGGRPREVEMREVLNTLFYKARSGCQWDMLPHDLLPKSTARDYFDAWRADDTWQKFLDALRPQIRKAQGRDEAPRVAYIDSQSVKATEMGGGAATTPARRSRAASGTSSSIAWDCCWPWRSPAPRWATAPPPRKSSVG